MIGYDLHPEAFDDIDDIDEIAAYIGQDSPEAAHQVVDEIYHALGGLVPFPHQGHRRTGLTDRPLRLISPRVMAAILRGRE